MSSMSLHALVRNIGPLTLVGAVVLTLVTGFGQVSPTGSSVGNAPASYRLADGSESTGKPPPKPHRGVLLNGESIQRLADGSESTGKPPPKPHNRSIRNEERLKCLADGSESTGKPPPKPHLCA